MGVFPPRPQPGTMPRICRAGATLSANGPKTANFGRLTPQPTNTMTSRNDTQIKEARGAIRPGTGTGAGSTEARRTPILEQQTERGGTPDIVRIAGAYFADRPGCNRRQLERKLCVNCVYDQKQTSHLQRCKVAGFSV